MDAQICKHMVIADGQHTCLISQTVMNARLIQWSVLVVTNYVTGWQDTMNSGMTDRVTVEITTR